MWNIIRSVEQLEPGLIVREEITEGVKVLTTDYILLEVAEYYVGLEKYRRNDIEIPVESRDRITLKKDRIIAMGYLIEA